MRTTPPARFVSNTLFPCVTKVLLVASFRLLLSLARSLTLTTPLFPQNALGPRNLNAFHTAMAQFLAHDLLMSGPPASNVGGGEPFAIPVPKDDPFFDPFGVRFPPPFPLLALLPLSDVGAAQQEGNKTIGFARNPIDAATGQTTPRVFYNLKTPFIDGGHVRCPLSAHLSALFLSRLF